jgi:hypothetical protein
LIEPKAVDTLQESVEELESSRFCAKSSGRPTGTAFIMTIDQLRQFRNASPFQPFEINLADGRSLVVDHPECLAVTSTGRTIGVAVGDVIEVVALLLVTSLKPRANGRLRRKGRH